MYYSCRRYCSFRVQKMMLVSQVNGKVVYTFKT